MKRSGVFVYDNIFCVIVHIYFVILCFKVSVWPKCPQ